MSALMKSEPTLFDYATVPEADRTWLQTQEDLIRAYARRAVMDQLAIGELLIAAQARLGRGHFMAWLECKTGLSYSTAHRLMVSAHWVAPYMEVLREHEDRIDICAIHRLSENPRPASLAEAVEIIKDGKHLTRAVAGELIAKHAPARKQVRLFEDEDPLERLAELCRATTLLSLGTVDDTGNDDDEPASVLYFGRAHYKDDGPLTGPPRHASGLRIGEVIDSLMGPAKVKRCEKCFDEFVTAGVPIEEASHKATKPLSFFVKKKGRTDGHAPECKTCSRGRSDRHKKDKRQRKQQAA